MMLPTHTRRISSPVGEFGDKFRKAREKKELSLDDVSNVTKISSRMLQAIEEEHFDRLPGGVFNKGFIRAYAKHLGLNSDDAVTDYLACLRQAQVDSHAGWDAEPGNGRGNGGGKSPEGPLANIGVKSQPSAEVELPELQLPRAEHVRPAKKEYLSGPPFATWKLIAVAALVLVLGIFFWMRRSRATHGTVAKSSLPPVTASAAAPVTSATAPSTPAASPTVHSARLRPATSPAPVAPSSPSSVPPTPDGQPSTDSEDLPVERPSRPASTAVAPADPTQIKVEKKGDVTIRSFGASTSKPAENSPATLTLVVRALENSWISVTSDGQLVTQETLIAPAATSFHASRELVVRVGNAAGVSFLCNGDELPPQGVEAEAKTFIFDAQGMRTATTPQPSTQNQ